MLRAPFHRFRTNHAGYPHRRMRLLIPHRPRINVPIVKVLALVPPWSGPGPGLHDEVVGLLEKLAVVGGIGVVEKLLAAGAADPSGDQPSPRDQIDLRQLLGHPEWMLDHGQRVADQKYPRFPGQPREDSGLHVHHAAHAERVAMMLVQADKVESQFLGVQILIDEIIVVFGRSLSIEVAIRYAEVSAVAQDGLFRNPARRTFCEISYFHRTTPNSLSLTGRVVRNCKLNSEQLGSACPQRGRGVLRREKFGFLRCAQNDTRKRAPALVAPGPTPGYAKLSLSGRGYQAQLMQSVADPHPTHRRRCVGLSLTGELCVTA